MRTHYLATPIKDEDISNLEVGDIVYLSNKIFTARDMAHLKLKEFYRNNLKFDEEFNGQVIFHAGPIVKKVADQYNLIAIGPTTSIRMEPYTEMIGSLGIKAIVGKGGMGHITTQAMKKHKMVYLVAAHGCAVVHSTKITKVLNQYWLDEIGMPEALWVLECEMFGPLIVGIDANGKNLFEEVKIFSDKMIAEKYPIPKAI